ncbi:MAG TPA: hypothetical protein VGW58_07720, partial [Pyrinomonadaceae bacterium]|nr:hypothetical protein [Pyrinomonadaceae bacterium]
MPISKLRHVPSVDQLLHTDAARQLRETVGLRRVTAIARAVTNDIRSSIRENLQENDHSPEALLAEAVLRIEQTAQQESQTGIKKVINATGVLLHTNLGRAPLSAAARRAIAGATGYATVEQDLRSGQRSRRGRHVLEALSAAVPGAGAALVVNNNAAALVLAAMALASDREIVISRGELL